ncbi:MAG: TetR/AcrR family transcriptional regulator, partial [Carnobacterium sp.]|nr:TetR/AcrR family transcriptional regulator [Carnobacterium sp.]
INSAMKEFSINSFQKASTNVIVIDAGISKGLLFHYFGTKDNLYKYLEYFSMKIIIEGIVDELDWNQKDIFLRLKEISMIKFKIMQRYPYLGDFSLLVFQDKTTEEIMHINPDFPLELYSQIYTHNIDYSLFKEDIDVKRAINIIQWTIEKCGDEFRRNIKDKKMKFDYKVIEKQILVYIDMLKVCFYKED